MPLSYPKTRTHFYLMVACLLFLPARAKADFLYFSAPKLSLDAKLHLFLSYKETVQNIFKNSQAGRAYIPISDVDEKLGLAISDDGIGCVYASTKRGTSIRLLVKRSYPNLHSSLS